MRRLLGCFAALGLATAASAAKAESSDIIGDLIARTVADAPAKAAVLLQARLYHGGGRGIRALDSLGCRVSAMRTLAVDPRIIPRRTVLFIKETVGMLLPNGGVHDGYWYASDIGGGIKGKRIDMFTGLDAGSMRQFMKRRLNVASISATPVGTFAGCPPV